MHASVPPPVRLLAALLIAAFLASVAPAASGRVLLTLEEMEVRLADEEDWCGETVHLVLNAPDPTYFEAEAREVQRMIAGLRVMLQFECPQVRALQLDGYAGGEQLFTEVASDANGWAVPAMTFEEPAAPPSRSELPKSDEQRTAEALIAAGNAPKGEVEPIDPDEFERRAEVILRRIEQLPEAQRRVAEPMVRARIEAERAKLAASRAERGEGLASSPTLAPPEPEAASPQKAPPPGDETSRCREQDQIVTAADGTSVTQRVRACRGPEGWTMEVLSEGDGTTPPPGDQP